MDERNRGMFCETVGLSGMPNTLHGDIRTADGFARVVMVVALVFFLLGSALPVSAQEAATGAAVPEAAPSDAVMTKPSGSTEAIMEAYDKKMESVMGQADPFYTIDPEEAFSAAEALKDNKQYGKALELYLKLAEETDDPEAFSGAAEAAEAAGMNEKAIELADEALERHEKQYEAMLTKAKAHSNLDQIPEARIMIEKALETMGEDGSGIDKAVMDLYKEIMNRSEEEAP